MDCNLAARGLGEPPLAVRFEMCLPGRPGRLNAQQEPNLLPSLEFLLPISDLVSRGPLVDWKPPNGKESDANVPPNLPESVWLAACLDSAGIRLRRPLRPSNCES